MNWQGESRHVGVVEALATKVGAAEESRVVGALVQLEEALVSAAADSPPDFNALLPTQVQVATCFSFSPESPMLYAGFCQSISSSICSPRHISCPSHRAVIIVNTDHCRLQKALPRLLRHG